ncbi:MAG: baseplate J/gp47 family protein [Oscillospiraceae bacterium]|nr:baseplate J/gp47 family protein [Oscillospiraceae bacterium]
MTLRTAPFFYDTFSPVAEWLYYLQSMLETLEDNAFALTAVGEYLDRKTAEQGLTRKAAEYASGTIRIYGNRGEVVQTGAKVASDSLLFAVDEGASIPEAGYVDLTATCLTAGAVGNVAVGEINRFPVTLPGLSSVENITAFSGGYDEETDADLLERYIEKVSRPNVSGNKYHYIEWAKEVTGVGDAQCIPLWNGAGTVKVVIIDSDNQPASDELVAEVAAYIEENRPVGAEVTVVSADALEISVEITLDADGNDNLQEDIENAISEYLSDVALNKSYVSYAKIGGLILSVDGVDDYTDLTVNGGTENISLSDGVIPVLSEVVIS